MLREFREFALKGNVIDLAVGIIIGAAFTTIVSSLVDDIIMPPLGYLLNGVDFSAIFWTLKEGSTPGPYNTIEAAKAAGAVTWNFGLFINAVLKFLIVAWALFFVVRGINRLKRKEEVKPAPVADVPAEQKLLAEIRDLLAGRPPVSPPTSTTTAPPLP